MTLKRFAWGIAALLLAATLLLVLGDWLLGRPAVKAAVQQRVSAALGGQIAWEDLDLHLLPAPRGALRKVRIEIPEAVSLRADQVDAYLRLWPLLRGQVEIASFSVARPEIRLAASAGARKGAEPADPLAAYRRAVEPAARALRRFAPDTQFRVDAADVDLPSVPLRLRALNATASTSADGVDLRAEAASNLWQRLRVEGRLTYADLSSRAKVELDELVLDPELPAARLRGELRTDAKSAIEVDADVSLGALVQGASAKLRIPAAGAPHATAEISGADLAQALAIARRKLPGLDAIEAAEGRLSAKVELVLQERWHAGVQIVRSDAALKLAALPWKLSVHAGHAAITGREVRVHGARGALGDSAFSEVTARIELGKRARLSAASGQATLRLEQWFPWLQKQLPLEEIAALTGNVDVVLQRLALRFDRPAEVAFDALATPRQVSAALKALPAPLSVTAGSAQVSATLVRLDRLAVALLDARVLVSGTVATKGPQVELALAEGALGEKAVQWAMARGEVPAHLAPRTPLRFAAKRIAWAPRSALEADASLDFEGGPAVSALLAWQPDKLDLRRLAIKDARSDALLGAHLGGELMQASFSGALYGRSVAAMLRQPRRELQGDSGVVRGKLLVKGNRKQPEQSVAEGRLQVDALDLSPLVGAKAILQSVGLEADGSRLRIIDARLEWEDQPVSLRGELRRTAQGPVLDAQLESSGVVVDRLLRPKQPGEKPAAEPAASKLWPLPVTGRVEVRAGFVQYEHYKVEPLQGSLVLERERASLQVKEAHMCGVSFPLSAEMTADSVKLSTQVTMKDQPLAAAGHCLTGEALEITGTADLRADLRTQGKPAELLRNLSGTAQGELRKGSIRKFALIGNVLSHLSLRNLVSRDPLRQQGGFPYRSLTAKGEFRNGEFLLEEGFLDSDAARLAASGKVDLLGADSQLTVLVGLLTTVDRVVDAIPIVGGIFGGTMAALPVSVKGDIRNPEVVPLGPRAITSQLLGIFERTLKLPTRLVAPAEAKPPPAQ
jgi:hypothetical protein